ncbi:cell adhesion molecule 3-like [Saccostrea cucullata]|uniref:cell adhesion molecule 3-like n=1 Tax=Saccostrea cuccullata TaxID=36930 RepID=UPI002ED2DE87
MLTSCFLSLILTKGITSTIVITPPEINASLGKDGSIALNCTFSEGTFQSLLSMVWLKKIGNEYNDIAKFRQYPEQDVRLSENGSYLINRSQLTIPGSGSSSSFILTINNIECRDDGKYRCVLNYLRGDGRTFRITGDTTVFLQVPAERPSTITVYPKSILRENDEVTLTCSANTGNPEGYIAIWKISFHENVVILLNRSRTTGIKNTNCSAVTHMTLTYILSRKDNGAIFSCSSQNRLTQVPGPSIVTDTVTVLYGPSYVKIDMWPTSPTVFVGSKVTLTCNSDGNPVPTFKWIYNSTNERSEKMRPLTWKKKKLVLHNVELNDSGVYCCVASNAIFGEILHKSSNIALIIQEQEQVTVYKQSCRENQCAFSERCVVLDHKVLCTTNIWSYIALPFIFFTLLFVVTTAVLCMRSSKDSSFIKVNREMMLGYLRSLKSKQTPGERATLNSTEQSSTVERSDTTTYEILNNREQRDAFSNEKTRYETLNIATETNTRYEALNNSEQTSAKYEVLDMASQTSAKYEVLKACMREEKYAKYEELNISGQDKARCEFLNVKESTNQ